MMFRSLINVTALSLSVLLMPLSCRNCDCQQPGASASPKEKPPQVDAAEILRRGDMVVVTGEGPRGYADEAMRMATAPPPDDSHMWFVTVIKTANCQYCEKLLSDFQKAPELLAFVAAAEPYKPWGHFNVYNASDATQKWRLKEYRVTAYPTLVIQPPRNGMWGSPRTVVWQKTGYDGNPKGLATEMTSAVRKFAAKMSEQGYPKTPSPTPPVRSESIANKKSSVVPVRYQMPVVASGSRQTDAGEPGTGQIGVDPPFQTPPRVDPFNPMPNSVPSVVPGQWPPPDQQVPQIVLPSLGQLVSLLFQMFGWTISGTWLTNLSLLILVGLRVLERTAPVTSTKLDDMLLSILKSLQNAVVTPTNPPVPTTPPQV